jgi:hypothetical protein
MAMLAEAVEGTDCDVKVSAYCDVICPECHRVIALRVDNYRLEDEPGDDVSVWAN